MRQAGIFFFFSPPYPRRQCVWDELGPGTLGCSAGTWTDSSLSHKIQRNYKGLKITECMCSWGKLRTTRYEKTKKPTATSEDPGAKAGWAKARYCARPLHTTPPKGWANHLSCPSNSTPAPAPTLTLYKEPTHRPASLQDRVSQGICYLFSFPPAAAGAPVKPWLNFLSGLLSISID